MKNKTRNYHTVLLLILFFILAGCSSASSSALYNKSAKEFNNTYFKIVKNIDVSNTLKSLKGIQTEEKNIEKLGKLVNDLKENLPKGREQSLNTFNERYEDLKFLKNSYTEFESLSVDDKIRINSIIVSIDLEKKNWEDKHSTIIWD